MSVGKGVAVAVGVLLLMIGMFTRHWWVGELMLFKVNVGLFAIEACFDTMCESASLGQITGGKSAAMWGVCRGLLVIFALLQVLVSIGCAWVALTGQRISVLGRVNTSVSGGAFFMGLGTLFLFPGGNEVSMSWSPACLFVGVLTLMFTNVAFTMAPREEFVPPVLVIHAAPKGEATAVAPASTSAAPPSGLAAAPAKAPAAIVAASKASELRHTVKSATVTAAGLTVVEPSGTSFAVSFADLVEIVARRLPPDPPHLGAVFVDFVVLDGARHRPLRVTAKTQASYTALPGGAAASAQENMRKLALFACLQNPAVRIEGESEGFVRKGTAAPLLQTTRDLEAFDARY